MVVFWRRSEKAPPAKATREQRPTWKEGEGSAFQQRIQAGHILGTMKGTLPSEGGKSNIQSSQGRNRGQASPDLVEDGKEFEFYS